MKRTPIDGDDAEMQFTVHSIFGASERRGLVEIQLGDTRVQVPIGKAREIRDMLTDVIEAAISDELLMRFLQERIRLSLEASGAALLEFREMRQGTRGTQKLDG
ncbi:MAG TPA: hypothetical protein VGP77_00295 [Vicinamibacterales bacterium]|nr:hypothetical protein [Vicinamibacterales bacterium]